MYTQAGYKGAATRRHKRKRADALQLQTNSTSQRGSASPTPPVIYDHALNLNPIAFNPASSTPPIAHCVTVISSFS